MIGIPPTFRSEANVWQIFGLPKKLHAGEVRDLILRPHQVSMVVTCCDESHEVKTATVLLKKGELFTGIRGTQVVAKVMGNRLPGKVQFALWEQAMERIEKVDRDLERNVEDGTLLERLTISKLHLERQNQTHNALLAKLEYLEEKVRILEASNRKLEQEKREGDITLEKQSALLHELIEERRQDLGSRTALLQQQEALLEGLKRGGSTDVGGDKGGRQRLRGGVVREDRQEVDGRGAAEDSKERKVEGGFVSDFKRRDGPDRQDNQ